MKRIFNVMILTAITIGMTAQTSKQLITSKYPAGTIAAAVERTEEFNPVPKAGDAFWRDSVPESMRRNYIEHGERYIDLSLIHI